MPTTLPQAYPFAESVPRKGGASCKTCIYLGDDKAHCENQLYRNAMGTKFLGNTAGQWCCMAWSEDDRGHWAKETD